MDEHGDPDQDNDPAPATLRIILSEDHGALDFALEHPLLGQLVNSLVLGGGLGDGLYVILRLWDGGQGGCKGGTAPGCHSTSCCGCATLSL